ncbi:MAG: 50S ribosomal protein L23, partial [Opitutales bacterium]|nr:50S ribosomal protein L23 [Opitutales bacterium]
IMNVKGKRKVSRMRRATVGIKGAMKKAIVTLDAGQSIQLA